MAEKVGEQAAEIFAVLGEVVEFAQDRFDFAVEDGGDHRENLRARSEAEHRKNVRFDDFVAAKTDQLIERRFGVAHAAFGAASDRVQGGVYYGHAFLGGDFAEVCDDQGRWNAAQIEALATRENRRKNFFRFGGREHEFHVLGRLFERFKKRIEGFLREHVNFVDDIDFEFSGGGRVPNRVAQGTDFFDAAVA